MQVQIKLLLLPTTKPTQSYPTRELSPPPPLRPPTKTTNLTAQLIDTWWSFDLLWIIRPVHHSVLVFDTQSRQTKEVLRTTTKFNERTWSQVKYSKYIQNFLTLAKIEFCWQSRVNLYFLGSVGSTIWHNMSIEAGRKLNKVRIFLYYQTFPPRVLEKFKQICIVLNKILKSYDKEQQVSDCNGYRLYFCSIICE